MNELAEYIPVERLLFGSDGPHVEGVVEPLNFLDSIRDFGAADQKRIMRDNLAELVRF